MINLTNGLPQGPDNLIVPNGSISFQLNTDATVIASPYGFVAADKIVVFQFNVVGVIQPNSGTHAQIWSNQELNPQNSIGYGTYYLITFYDQNGARLNTTPLWWQFQNVKNSTVDIGSMTAYISEGNVIYYPSIATAATPGGSDSEVQVNIGGVLFGDGTFTWKNNVGTLDGALTITANAIGASPLTLLPFSGSQTASLLVVQGETDIITATLATSLVNFNSPLLTIDGTYWTGSASAEDSYLAQNVIAAGTNPATALTFTHTGSGAGFWDFIGNIGCLNNTPATALSNQSSPILTISGTYWTGAVSAVDTFTIQNVINAGANPGTSLNIHHSGSAPGGGIGLEGPVNITSTLTVGSITQGAAGAITQQQNHGETLTYGSATELLTLSLASAHTDTSGNLLPVGSIIDCVLIYITQTISGGSTPTTIAVGDAGTSNRFISTGTALTAGASAVGLNQIDAGTSAQAAAAKVRVTLDQIPGQGIVRITVFYRQFSAPSS